MARGTPQEAASELAGTLADEDSEARAAVGEAIDRLTSSKEQAR